MSPFLLPDGRQASALTVAGSDSGGNAGVQADLRAFHAFGVHGCTAFAALTAQNPSGVSGVHEVPAAFLGAQLDAVFAAYAPGAAKTGMLSSADAIAAVADRFAVRRDIPLVVDPVMVATSGARLIRPEAEEALAGRLLPLAALATPNLPEAEVLAGTGPVRDRAGMAAAAREIARRAGCAVLVKGGHRADAPAEDFLWTDDGAWWLSTPFVAQPLSTHGTGCSLSAAIAACLALGRPLPEAVAAAKGWVFTAIRDGVPLSASAAVLGFGDPAAGAAAVTVLPA